MRWKIKPELDGDTRDIFMFAWKPVIVSDGTTRWLEFIYRKEIFRACSLCSTKEQPVGHWVLSHYVGRP
jgi:hypothetical protein